MWDPEWHQVDIPSILPQKQVGLPRIEPSPNPSQSSRNSFPSPMSRPLGRPVLNLGHFGHFDLVHSLKTVGGQRKTTGGEDNKTASQRDQSRSEKIQHQCHLRCLWNLTHPGTPSQEHFAHDLWNTFEAKFPAPIFGCQTSHNNGCKSVFKKQW